MTGKPYIGIAFYHYLVIGHSTKYKEFSNPSRDLPIPGDTIQSMIHTELKDGEKNLKYWHNITT